MSYPKITYTWPGGALQTLQFQLPPRRQPAYMQSAVRHDNVSSSGIKESVLERIEQFFTVEMDTIFAGADQSAWQSFLYFAITGASFQYYPDASVNIPYDYVLEDTKATIEYVAVGLYKLAMKWRALEVSAY